MTTFADLPDSYRMACRFAAEFSAGANVDGYIGGLQLSLPVDHVLRLKLRDALASLRLQEKPGSRFYFPLGTDRAPEHLNHGGNWLCTTYIVADQSIPARFE